MTNQDNAALAAEAAALRETVGNALATIEAMAQGQLIVNIDAVVDSLRQFDPKVPPINQEVAALREEVERLRKDRDDLVAEIRDLVDSTGFRKYFPGTANELTALISRVEQKTQPQR